MEGWKDGRLVFVLLGLASLCLAGCGRDVARPEAAAEEQAPAPRSSETVAATDFKFPTDDAGKLLEERLTPPRQVTLPPMPFASEPRPWRAAKLDRLPDRLRPLPQADVPAQPRRLQSEVPIQRRPRPALDLPPLAGGDFDPMRPARPELPSGPKAYVASPNPDTPPPLPVLARQQTEVIAVTTDPTVDRSRQAALVVVSVLRDQPAPFLRLTIPDPFEHIRLVQLRMPPPDADEPASPTSRPPVPAMPVKP